MSSDFSNKNSIEIRTSEIAIAYDHAYGVFMWLQSARYKKQFTSAAKHFKVIYAYDGINKCSHNFGCSNSIC